MSSALEMPFGFDHVVLGVMFVFGFVGFFAGGFRSLLDIGAILIGLVAAIAATSSPDIIEFAKAQTDVNDDFVTKTVVMIVVFLGAQVLVALAGWVGTIGVDMTPSYGDRLLGGAVGAARGFLMFVVFFLVNAVGYQVAGYSPQAPPGSITYPLVSTTGRLVLNAAIPFLPDDIAAVAADVKL